MTIRAATPEDADAIRNLLVEDAGERIGYSIYQAPMSTTYIAATAGAAGRHACWQVMEDSTGIVGFYQSAIKDAECFLNYVVVRRDMRGRGLGRLLLLHFEAESFNRGATTLSLDVFGGDEFARSWYDRAGYAGEASEYIFQIDIFRSRPSAANAVCWNSAEMASALKQEAELGFSKIACNCNKGTVLLGLINRTSCKVLARENISLHDAAEAVLASMQASRKVLILCSPLPPSPHWPLLDVQHIWRLSKPRRAPRSEKTECNARVLGGHAT